MTILRCLHCSAETTNGLALCEADRIGVSVYLEFLPVYFRNLARWTPGHAGSRPVPGSRVLYSGEVNPEQTGDRISDDLFEAWNALTTYARMLTDDRGLEPPIAESDAEQVALLCRWFAEHLTSVATLDWCGDFVRDLSRHEAKLRELTERAAPGWYAGRCQRDDCETPTYVVPGLTWVTCDGCGATTYARDHLNAVLDEAREHIDRPMRLAEIIVALVDTEMNVPRLYERIKKWGQRAQQAKAKALKAKVKPDLRRHIEVIRTLDVDGDEVGPMCFRLGDVLDRLRAEGETRAAPKVRRTG